MLTYEEMEYITAFSKLGTLSEVAEQYHISQPIITRAMKKAEEEFGISLFNRTKNSIMLNDNGKFAVREILAILKETDEMIDKVRAYDKASRTISIGSAAAVQIPNLIRKLTDLHPNLPISTELKKPYELEKGLENDTYQLIVLPYQTNNDNYICKKIGEEHLMFLLPKNHKFAKHKSLRMSEMNGENMLLFSDIGFWADIVKEKMPDSKFLVQNERYSLEELIINSILPCFTSDMVYHSIDTTGGRIAIPIEDDEVNITYFVVYKKSNKTLLRI